MTGGSVRREWVVCRRAAVTRPLAAGGPAQIENPAGFPAEPAAGRTLMKVMVLPFANVHALVKAKCSAAWTRFTVGKDHASSVPCGETMYNRLLCFCENFTCKRHHKIEVWVIWRDV